MPPALRVALTDDASFDEKLPAALQPKSSLHFTPLEVARYAAQLLAPRPGMSVLDVGAGAGKFCLAAALEVPGARFVGVEQRPELVQVASRLAREWQISNACFIAGDAFALDWSQYDGFYFFNPFGEQLFEHGLRLDHTIEHEPANYLQHVMAVHKRLASARLGTRVVTYHGYGAPPPPGYELASVCAIGTDHVELWIKNQDVPDDHEPEAESA